MMLPLVDTVAGDGAASLAVALLAGGAFGWTLERAGLGSARKLAAQFHLADFTVVKVMFTAIVTAMLGLFWLARVGVLDVARLAVPETWLVPQVVGGALFGVGFVVGGLCPGTACVAGAAGRLDGVAAVAGLFAGTLAFELGRPVLGAFPERTPRGALRLPELLGTSEGATVALVAGVALLLFVAVRRLERARGLASAARPRAHAPLVLAAAVLALGAAVPASDVADPLAIAREIEGERDHVTALELARWIRADRPGLRVIDVRAESAYRDFHIPGAEHTTLDALLRERPRAGETLVLYSEGGTHAAQGWVLLRASGRRDVYVLREGLYEWLTTVMEPTLPADADSARRAAWPEVSALSRWFGGMPRAMGVGSRTAGVGHGAVPFPSLPTSDTPRPTSDIVRGVRRRGC